MLTLLNILITIIFIVAYLPQYKTILNNRAPENLSGISSYFWLLVTLSTMYSFFNTVGTGSETILVYFGQCMNFVLAFGVLSLVTYFKHGLSNALGVVLAFVFSSLMFYGISGIVVTQFVASVAIVWAYVDQLTHFYRTKQANGSNPLLYYFFAFGLSLLIILMYLTDVSTHVIATEVINTILLLICGVSSQVLNNKNKTEVR